MLQQPVNMLFSCFLKSFIQTVSLGSKEAHTPILELNIRGQIVFEEAEELEGLCPLYATGLENTTASFKNTSC